MSLWPAKCDVKVTNRMWRPCEPSRKWRQCDQPDVTFNMTHRVCDVNVTYRMWRQCDPPDVTFNRTYRAGRQCYLRDVTSTWTIVKVASMWPNRTWLSIGLTGCVTSMWPTGCDVNVNHQESGVYVTQPDVTFNRTYRVCDVNMANGMWRQCEPSRKWRQCDPTVCDFQ